MSIKFGPDWHKYDHKRVSYWIAMLSAEAKRDELINKHNGHK